MRCASACQAFPAPVQKHHSFWRRARRQLFRVRDQGVPTEVFPKSLGWQWGNQSHQREGKQRIGEKLKFYTASFFFHFGAGLFSLLFFLFQNESHLPRGRSWPFPFHSMRKRQIYISGRSRCWSMVSWNSSFELERWILAFSDELLELFRRNNFVRCAMQIPPVDSWCWGMARQTFHMS